MKNSPRWRIGVLASAVALLGSLASLEAHALALGRITVQSALGEPLRAEVDISNLNPEEAASLKARVASPEMFKAAGLEYNAVVAAGLDVRLQRRADGRAYLRLTSTRAVAEPFVDLIIEANWASGRVSRDYTLLLDPPNLRSRVAVEPNAPQLSQPAVTPAPVASRQSPAPYSPLAATLRPAPVKTRAARTTEVKQMPAGDKQLTVKSGDTAGKIAALNKPSGVSLDQMLVALLQGNPDAFMGGNVNRIKSGAVLNIPDSEAAGAISAREASQTIIAQSKDFNAFRRRLASNAPTTQTDNADRQAGGKVQAKVEDHASANATPDKLTLSKGQVQGKPAAANEEEIARDKEAKATASRIAELSRNIAELNKLTAAPGAATIGAQPAATPPASPNAPASSAPGIAEGSAAKVAEPASAALSGTAPLAAALQPTTASRPAAAAAKAKPVAPPVPSPSESSVIDQLRDNPLLVAGIAALLALLGGFGFYRYRQNKKGHVDSSFFESRLQPDSFFGASGGQHIDTSESHVNGSSMSYASSQLDATGDVDPVAEADVYLAYGRDLQAEEILKEALRSHPARVAIHAKLLEIYAKRQDTKAFESVAIDAFKLTQGNGPEWAYIAEAGRRLDPSNPMYQANGQPAANPQPPEIPIGADLAAAISAAEIAVPPLHAIDRDLDLDLSFPQDEPSGAATAPAGISVTSPYEQPAATPPPLKETPLAASLSDLDLDLDLDLNLDFGKATAALPRVIAAAHPLASMTPVSEDIDFAPQDLDFTPESFTKPLPLIKPGAHAASPASSGMFEFDMNSLSLELGPLPAPAADNGQDPLEVKLLLAEEFLALDDSDGARSLAGEVLDQASGPLKAKAQAFLNSLS